MVEVQKRQIAYKISIEELNSGSYVKQEGWKPNYILTKDGRKVSRVNLFATIISIQSDSPTQTNISIDDGTGNLTIRTFEETDMTKGLEIGEIITVIGRPREFNDLKYIVPEILKKIKDTKWIEVRQKELAIFKIKNNLHEESPIIPNSTNKIKEVNEKKDISLNESSVKEDVKKEVIEKPKEDLPINDNINPKQKVYLTIKKLDKGEGVDIDDVIIFSKIEESEEIIKMLLKEGEIFEIKKGRLKVLE